jgi:hypothetical protein
MAFYGDAARVRPLAFASTIKDMKDYCTMAEPEDAISKDEHLPPSLATKVNKPVARAAEETGEIKVARLEHCVCAAGFPLDCSFS